MEQENQQPIVVNLPENGNGELVFLQGVAPKQLDQRAPLRIDIGGTIESPLEFLKKRVNNIDQHKAHILVCRDNLKISLVIQENDPYNIGSVVGKIEISKLFETLGINGSKQWVPEQLGQFLKLNRSIFPDRDENNRVVNALKSFNANVNQTVERESKENGNRTAVFRQAVNSNIPDKFTVNIPIVKGGQKTVIEIETCAYVDGQSVMISLQSPGANDIIDMLRTNAIDDVVEQIRDIAPDIVIIEQ
ncbi:MAG: hypothetical protein II604_00450 [Bacteroidales bacterium]|nr:hypothetical protein [Bacteroidales bacterium]